MTWLRLDDLTYDEPLVRAVGNAAYGALVRMSLYASAQRTDGWIPEDKAREIASRAELRTLTATTIGDQSPLLHRPGDICPCLEAVKWPAAPKPGVWVHDFLARNPSRAENDVHRAKRKELKDKELRAVVRARDGDRCRYCGITVKWADRRSASGGVLDHVDPRIADGAANLVVACRGCNGRKKDCDPIAAGMDLLPVPGSQTNTGSTPDLRQTNGETQNQTQNRPGTDPGPDPSPDLNPDPSPDPGPEPPPYPKPQLDGTSAPTERTQAPTPDPTRVPMTDGTGRGGTGTGSRYRDLVGDAGPAGHRPTIGPATTPRSALAPNPYFKAATANPPPPTPPPEGDP